MFSEVQCFSEGAVVSEGAVFSEVQCLVRCSV